MSSTGSSTGELDWGARLGNSIGEDVRTSPPRISGIRIWCALQLRTTIVNAGRGFCRSVCGVARSVRRPWVNWLLTLPAAYSESMVGLAGD